MRIAFAGLAAFALTCSLALGQNVAQPGAAGQRLQGGQTVQPGQPGQPTQPGQIRGGQGEQGARLGQAGQPGQPGQPGQQGQLRQQGQFGQQGQSSRSDQELAAKIFGAVHNEVELAKFVQSRLQSQEAKDFAQMMIKDHSPEVETYGRLAGNLASQDQRGGAQPGGGQQAGAQQGEANWVSIHKELAQQCLQSIQKELSQKQGIELDQCFMTQQAFAHAAMKDELTVLRKHASPQLAQQIDKSLEGVSAHLEHAKEIVKKLEDGPSERVSRRPDGQK